MGLPSLHYFKFVALGHARHNIDRSVDESTTVWLWLLGSESSHVALGLPDTAAGRRCNLCISSAHSR